MMNGNIVPGNFDTTHFAEGLADFRLERIDTDIFVVDFINYFAD